MDLGAYVQIDELEGVLLSNGINIPRLRGLRLMRDEKKYTEEETRNCVESAKLWAYSEIMETVPPFTVNANMWAYTNGAKKRHKKYIIYDKNVDWFKPAAIRWDLIHGKQRKAMKFQGKIAARKELERIRTWNKYAGQDDVLYIHARLGSSNWSDVTWKDYRNEPWFLYGEDDSDDSSYCNIYAKVNIDI